MRDHHLRKLAVVGPDGGAGAVPALVTQAAQWFGLGERTDVAALELVASYGEWSTHPAQTRRTCVLSVRVFTKAVKSGKVVAGVPMTCLELMGLHSCHGLTLALAANAVLPTPCIGG